MTGNFHGVTLEELEARCVTLGLVIRRPPTYHVVPPPITLQPTTVSVSSLEFVKELQPSWNRLMDRVSRDYQFLLSALRDAAASDAAFTGRLLDLLSRVYCNEGAVVQELMLGIFRTDYMRDAQAAATGVQEWRNVEINTISCSFAGLAPRVASFHRFLLNAKAAEEFGSVEQNFAVVPVGNSDTAVPAALAMAHRAMLQQQQLQDVATPQVIPVVVFVVQENERNTADQFTLAMQLQEAHQVRSIRRTMSELHTSMVLKDNGVEEGRTKKPPTAIIDGRYLVTVFYFRCAYVPQDFVSEGCWQAREAIERSSAVKCPSIPTHLSGFKKIQQLLTDDAILSKFESSSEIRSQLQSTFMTQWSLDAAEVGESVAEERIAAAIAEPQRFVLKPQLEGGGNLLAGAALREALQLPPTDPFAKRVRSEFILMERIQFPRTTGSVLRFGEVVTLKDNLCCELGIFGTILSESVDEILLNDAAGTLVRSKAADFDDGGVMAGNAALDSLMLV